MWLCTISILMKMSGFENSDLLTYEGTYTKLSFDFTMSSMNKFDLSLFNSFVKATEYPPGLITTK